MSVIKQVSRMAFLDMYDMFKELKREQPDTYIEQDKYYDVWVATEQYVNTKESRKLNRLLGIHKVNKRKWTLNK